MNQNPLVYIVSAITIAVVVTVFLLIFRRKGRVKINAPGGAGIELEGTNESGVAPSGVHLKNVKSRQGGLTAYDGIGRGVVAQDVEVEKDIDVRTIGTPPSRQNDPKA